MREKIYTHWRTSVRVKKGSEAIKKERHFKMSIYRGHGFKSLKGREKVVNNIIKHEQRIFMENFSRMYEKIRRKN